MRVHVNLDDELVRELDRRAGTRGRSAYIAATFRRALDDERRWEDISASVGKVAPSGHEWDEDPAAWVGAQRSADAQRLG